MDPLIGKYEMIYQSPETKDYLTGSGYDEKFANRILTEPTIGTVTEEDGVWKFWGLSAGVETITKFRLGEVYDDYMPQGQKYKSVTRREGNTLITESVLPNGKKATRVYEFTEDGLNSNVGLEDCPRANRIYKRLEWTDSSSP